MDKWWVWPPWADFCYGLLYDEDAIKGLEVARIAAWRCLVE